VQVALYKTEQKGRRACGWEALRETHAVPGAYMGVDNRIPHDLAQFVIEAETRYANGLCGSISTGATFKSTGRRRTKPGRAIIA
jgi:hypothetical protein